MTPIDIKLIVRNVKLPTILADQAFIQILKRYNVFQGRNNRFYTVKTFLKRTPSNKYLQ